MVEKKYGYKPANTHESAIAAAKDMRVSFKKTREASQTLRGMKVGIAIGYLESVLEHKRCVPMRRYARGCGRTKQAKEFNTQRGRWPSKSCNLLIYVLKNLKANAKFKKIDNPDELVISHVQINKAPKIRRRLHRARGMINQYNSSPCHVEIIAEKEQLVIKDGVERVDEVVAA